MPGKGTSRKDMQALLRLAGQQGWTYERSGAKHWVLTSPSGQKVFIPFSPGEGRSLQNNLAMLRRFGLETPGKGVRTGAKREHDTKEGEKET
jgi:hypothetical protein